MNSCLYECSVMHHRLAPKVHRFQHDIFMFYLDLDELDFVSQKIALFSHNRNNLYSFRDSDHEPAGGESLKQRISAYLSRNGIRLGSSGRIMLLTLPRVFGYIFNPISIYFCFGADGVPVCSVAEVGNTFREMKLYLIQPDETNPRDTFTRTVTKHFYVSPFSGLDLKFDFNLRLPDDRLAVKIDDLEEGGKTLVTTLTGRRAGLTNRTVARFTVKYPFITLKVIFLIHWHAFRLWLKGVPFFRKGENAPLQREVLRPYSK